MNNVVITGSGRSGTSMLAGCFSQSGYFMGNDILVPNPGNPKGLFEDTEINLINEDLLAPFSPKPYERFDGFVIRHYPLHHQRWLLERQGPLDYSETEAIRRRIKSMVAQSPFCFKDPRFSYTLPIWQRYITNTVYIVVFRSPLLTSLSIVKECEREKLLHSLHMNQRRAMDVWLAMYQSILTLFANGGDWLFVHYDQVLSGEAFGVIEEFTGATLDRSFPTTSLKRTRASRKLPKRTINTYRKLCELARFTG